MAEPGKVGKRIGHYQVVSELGQGGMGEVYQAQDTRLGRLVALKFLPQPNTQDLAAVDRFIREARAASALNHPNIVTIHEIGEDPEAGRFIVMEFIQGRTLRAMIGEDLPAQTLVQIALQTAWALTVAHAAGIIHRDIKPENIMVREDGYVKVLDFGLARLAPSGIPSLAETAESPPTGTSPGTLLGTVRYMSPEQARGEAVTSATDIFSLGVTLYEFAARQHPFQADSAIGVLSAVLWRTPLLPSRLNPAIPGPLDALILRMLEKDPRLRPNSAEVASALAELARKKAVVEARPVMYSAKRHTVGRKKELEELRAGFESAVSGRGQILCVAGEPGIGKTTLVEDFFAELTSGGRNCHIARGRCSERLAGSEAYLPLLEALESLLRGEGSDSAARVMKAVAPTWYVQVAPLAGDSSAARILAEAKSASQERMKRELFAFTQEVTRLRPLIFFLDDLHWADLSTVDLLAYLGSKVEAMRVLIVGTYRPSDLLLAKSPFSQVKLELQGRGVCREIPVEFLTRQDIETYLALEFPEHRFAPEFAALIHAKTQGNPLFMVDLVRYLRDRKVVAEDQGRWVLAQSVPNLEHELPESVRSMIQKKIEQLSDADRRLLVAASVQGHEFDSAVVARALALDPGEVEERLEVLDRVHAFVRLLGDREFPDSTLTLRYSFVHVLYQNALYGSLMPTRKAALSSAVANALLGYFGEKSSEIASELAFLFEAARDFARAADDFLVAAENAVRIFANQEALALLSRARANAEKLQGEARASRLLSGALQRAQVDLTLSRFQDAIADFDMAEKAAGEVGDYEAQINSICGRGMVLFNLKRLPEVREEGNRALEIAKASQSMVGVASAEVVLACERMCSGDLATAEQYFDRAVPVLKEKGSSLQALEALGLRGLLLTWRLEYEEMDRVSEMALEKARDHGACYHIILNLFTRAMAFGNRGRLSEALGLLNEGWRLAELNAERYWLPRLPNTMGWIYRELQDFETALRLDTKNVPMAQEMGFPEGEANAHVNLAHDYLALEELDNALQHLRDAERIYNQDVWFRWRFNIRMQAELANYWIAQGDLKLASSHAAASLEVASMSQARKYIAWAHKLFGDIAALEDREEASRREYDMALEALQRHPCPLIEWKILKAAAALARRVRNESLADELFGRARAVVQTMADAIREEDLRQKFLVSRAVRLL